MLYADDLVLTAESLENLTEKFEMCRSGMNSEGLRVNMGKTKVMIRSIGQCSVLVRSIRMKVLDTKTSYCKDQ